MRNADVQRFFDRIAALPWPEQASEVRAAIALNPALEKSPELTKWLFAHARELGVRLGWSDREA